jgi:alkylhydroperoxidase family enzyme
LYRVSTQILEVITARRWGFPANLMAPLVRELGPAKALIWFAVNLPRYERTLAVFGPVRTHLLATAISLVNGCDYCSFGHGYALELAYLREHNRLFPLSEQQLAELCGRPPALIRHRLQDAVRRAGLQSDSAWLDRAIELAGTTDPRPAGHDEVRTAHLVRMLGVLNAAAIADRTRPDQAHDALNKDIALKSRYHSLRRAPAT